MDRANSDYNFEEEKSAKESMPIAINTPRPSSAGSVPSVSSANGAPRSTTTSRRGGRNRARSPAVSTGRLSNELSNGPNGAENPSSAAAAAAAAAKAYASNSGGRNTQTWPENNIRGDAGYQHSSNWPGEHGSSRYSQGYGGYQQHGQYRSAEEAAYHDRRYRDPRGRRYEGEGNRGPPPSRAAHAGYYPSEYRHGSGPRDTRGDLPKRVGGGGGTSLVIGGATPIHVPKPTERGGSASSVFRGRSADDGPGGATLDDDSPQKILLSLRTPSMSFDEKDGERGRKTTGLPPSPDDPPRIQNSHKRDEFFERTPDGSKNSIDIAPSFTLFNQSFDSLGDVQLNSDSMLQTDSFGMGRTRSVDNDASNLLLQQNPSAVDFATQFLAGSGSGALTIGYSPVNSFSNASAGHGSRRKSGMMILGGPDPHAASPTHVYRSHSNGGLRPGPLDDSHLRMSVGSFGAQSMSRSYAEQMSPNYYYSMNSGRSHDATEREPPFYMFLRRYRAAFRNCSFLLPGLKAALLEAPLSVADDGNDSIPTSDNIQSWENGMKPMHGHLGYPNVSAEPSPQDLVVAHRRVESSVCAFGGSLNKDRADAARERDGGSKDSIFRGGCDTKKQESATVTPSSSTTSRQQAPRFASRSRMKYEEELPGRYYENESRLSWEFEENPPVEVGEDDDDDKDGNDQSKDNVYGNHRSKDSDSYCKSVGDQDSTGKRNGVSPQPKMRYRCKLCGQPKQNHTCPYQQSLARSIGINVYPAVNAFAAAEPGSIAPPLSEMNNFVDVQREMQSAESSPNRPTPDRMPRMTPVPSTTQVTPESMRSSPKPLHSPTSLPPPTSHNLPRRSHMGSEMKKRKHSQMGGPGEEPGDLLFLESMEIQSEQFRSVTQPRNVSLDAYTYPALPLPYAQRKRLSDNLFSLSNEVPKLTDECAQVLREAREKDMWDVAVAELMTQVVVIIHCPDGDHRFEGLRQYLLTLGIAS